MTRAAHLALCAAYLMAAGCSFDGAGLGASRAQDRGLTVVDGLGPPEMLPAVDQGALDSAPDDPCAGMTCLLGCDTEKKRCKRAQPSNFQLAEIDVTEGAAELEFTASAIIDTDSGEIRAVNGPVLRPMGRGAVANIVFKVVSQQPGMPEIGVFVVRRLVIAPNVPVEVRGARALAFYVEERLDIAGDLVAPGYGATPGPGGYGGGDKDGAHGVVCFGGQGGGGGESGSGGDQKEAGGGGGGRYGGGGAGGFSSSFPSTAAGAPGSAGGDVALAPLYGGCGGGAGGGPDYGPGGSGGGGGGAIQLTCSGLVTISGRVSVPGGGGLGGLRGAGGGGGGSGGAILIETPQLAFSGVLSANGGGGGGGSGSIGDSKRRDGQAGLPSAQPAAGAPSAGSWGAAGGAGGAGAIKDGTAGGNNANGGGGGGAMGIIRVNSPIPAQVSGTVSPQPSVGTTLPTW